MLYRIRFRGKEHVIGDAEFVVGRATDCDIVLDDPQASRRHAAFIVKNGRLLVRDLKSRNGVTVNGTAVTGDFELDDEDVVGIGTEQVRVLGARAMSGQVVRAQRDVIPTDDEESEATTTGDVGWLAVDEAYRTGDAAEAHRLTAERLRNMLVDIGMGRS